MTNHRFLLSLGLILLILGVALPFLMVMQVLESTFFLNFLSWGASMAGLMLGRVGLALYAKARQK